MRLKKELPHSSFLSVEKDMEIIVNCLLNNNRLKRLLFYTTPDALDKPDITDEQTIEMIGKQIKNIPKVQIDKELLNYVIISFDNFTETSNPEFRDNTISFDIICHFDQWQLKDFKLRPYKIAAEIDSLINDKKMSGIGRIQFVGASQIVLNDEFAGLTLIYKAVHGGEDKYNLPNPNEQAKFNSDYQKMLKELK